MPLKQLFQTNTVKRLLVIPLIFLLVGCGQNINSTPKINPSQQVVSSGIPLSLTIRSVTINVANIHIYSGHGIVCLNYETLNISDPNTLIADLVLATNRLTYDINELQQLKTYATSLYGMTTPSHSLTLPSTLSWVPGTMVGDFPNLRFPGIFPGGGCFGEMELTNTGNNAILIRSLNMKLTAVSQSKEQSQYRMIDICSLLENSFSCPPQAGGGGSVLDYFRLNAKPVGTVFIPQKQAINDPNYQSGTDIILNPNDPYVLPILFYFTSLDKLEYSLTPELVLDTPNGAQQTFALPQLATTLYFADSSQFSCYTLQGDTFIKENSLYERGYCI